MLCFLYEAPCYPIGKLLSKQEELVQKMLSGDTTDWVICAELKEVYTYNPVHSGGLLFRNGDALSLQAPLVAVNRGGSITFHGPGQLVCYFIFNLHRTNITAQDLFSAIETSTIELLARYRITGVQKPAHLPQAAAGVWVEGAHGVMRKIASRGLFVNSKGITQFGCAINLSTDLRWFDAIFPCGLDIEMTSVKREVETAPDVLDTAYIFSDIFTANFELLFSKEKRHSG